MRTAYICDEPPCSRAEGVPIGTSCLKCQRGALQEEVAELNANPAKMSDSRAQRYVEEHGDSSWEVDALPPETLRGIITARLEELVDDDERERVQEQEEKDREALQKLAKKLSRDE